MSEPIALRDIQYKGVKELAGDGAKITFFVPTIFVPLLAKLMGFKDYNCNITIEFDEENTP